MGTQTDSTSEQTLIFLHIPKAAGSTFTRILTRQYKSEVTYAIDGADVRGSIERIQALSTIEKQRIRLLRGHMHFGLHVHLPQPSIYVTILRHPVERVVSLYNYLRRHPNHYLYDAIVSQRMSLEDFVRSGISTEVDNGQTRLLSGLEEADAPPAIEYGKCSQAVLEEARKNLEASFAVVGLVDRFDETLILLRHAFGWQNVLYGKTNVTKVGSRNPDISAETLSLIAKHNELDIRILSRGVEEISNTKPPLWKNLWAYRARSR
jgi:hypothetical protein